MSKECAICSVVICIVVTIIIFIIDATVYSDEEDYDYYYDDDDGNSIGPGGGNYGHSFIFGGGGRGGGGSGGTRLGSSRGGGYCFSSTTVVWTKNETALDITARHVHAIDLREGDLVGTLDFSSSNNPNDTYIWTRATDVSVYRGNWTAHTFVFSNNQFLTVTSPHLMIIFRNEKFYFIRADGVHIGDTMIANKTLVQVTSIQNHILETKVAIETESGSILANNVWASGFCDDNADAINRVIEYQSTIENYRSKHFGDDYNDMCMDELAWKITYTYNNGLLE